VGQSWITHIDPTEGVDSSSERSRLKSIAQCRIQISDIVDVMMSTLFILIRNHKFKMAIKLQGILISDTTYTDVSICKEITTIPQELQLGGLIPI
jgi:hypothetical protein